MSGASAQPTLASVNSSHAEVQGLLAAEEVRCRTVDRLRLTRNRGEEGREAHLHRADIHTDGVADWPAAPAGTCRWRTARWPTAGRAPGPGAGKGRSWEQEDSENSNTHHASRKPSTAVEVARMKSIHPEDLRADLPHLHQSARPLRPGTQWLLPRRGGRRRAAVGAPRRPGWRGGRRSLSLDFAAQLRQSMDSIVIASGGGGRHAAPRHQAHRAGRGPRHDPNSRC